MLLLALAFQVGVVNYGGDRYLLSSDHPARYLADGRPELPVGAVLTLSDVRSRSLNVTLAAPLSLNRQRVQGSWTQTLSARGEYRLQFSPLYSPLDPAVVDFVVAGPDTDGDGIPDEADACPLDNPQGRDADQDGCPDTVERLSAAVSRMPLEPGLKRDLLYACQRASLAAGRGDKAEASRWLQAFGARAAAASPSYRRMLRDLAANAAALL